MLPTQHRESSCNDLKQICKPLQVPCGSLIINGIAHGCTSKAPIDSSFQACMRILHYNAF